MTDKAIAPCPFCGHVGGDLDFYEGSTFRWLTVGCSACGATCGEVRIQTMGEGTREEWLAKAKQEGVALWNTRAAQPDCRTCLNRSDCDHNYIPLTMDCTNGDKYQPAPKVVLWRTEP